MDRRCPGNPNPSLLSLPRTRIPRVFHPRLGVTPCFAGTPFNINIHTVQTLARLAERPSDLSSADAEPDCVLLTHHDAVFTLGTGSTLDHLRFDLDDAPFGEVVRTERGGEVTYHGPGQVKRRVCKVGRVRVHAV